MIKRLLYNEFVEYFARPLLWCGLTLACMLVLAGLNQLDLDANKAKVLILDQSDGQDEGYKVKKLVEQIGGISGGRQRSWRRRYCFN